MTSMVRGALAVLICGLVGCQGGLPIQPSFSREAEALAGRRAAPTLEQRFGGIECDPVAEARLCRAGERLACCLPAEARRWRYSILRSDQVNAFSLPGGLIYVTRGLYERIEFDESLLDAVLAHEMSHVLRQDSLKHRCGTAEESLSREVDTDAGAVVLLKAAGRSAEPLDRLLALTADVQPPGWAMERRARLPVTTAMQETANRLARADR